MRTTTLRPYRVNTSRTLGGFADLPEVSQKSENAAIHAADQGVENLFTHAWLGRLIIILIDKLQKLNGTLSMSFLTTW
jgi:hypothetical protein